MTIPWQHNCSHSPDGWCLECVRDLALERDRLIEALRELFDRQNGPPLLAPRHKNAWEAAMKQAEAALAATEKPA